MYGLSSHQGERGTLGPHPASELDESNREVEKKDRENKSRAAEVQQLRIELQRYISEVNN